MRQENYCESKQTYSGYSLDKASHFPEFQATLFFMRNWVGGFYRDCLLNLIYKAWVLKNNYYCLQANSPQQLKKFYEKSKTVTPKWVNNDKFIYPCTCKDILIGVDSVLFLNELTWSFLVQYFLTAFQRVLQVTWKTFLLGCSKGTH